MTHTIIFRSSLALAASLLVLATGHVCGADAPLHIGSRRELFVDEYLIEKMSGVSLRLHHPEEREIVLRFDKPWESSVSGFFTVFKDAGKYRMYYRGGYRGGLPPTFVCYAESADGIQWTRPNLGLYEFEGSKENNIVWATSEQTPAKWKSLSGEMTKSFDNFSVFKDENPGTPASQRYKAVGEYPLEALVSPDGIHWQKLQEQPIITHGDFDTQNVVFYDSLRQHYRAYYRGYRKGVRDILTATSPDFIHWDDDRLQWIVRSDGLDEQLYTNATTPYFRAPQLFIAMPMRYLATRPEKGKKNDGWRGVTDAVFMTSRDGLHFDRRFLEAFIRPGLDEENWVTRNTMPAYGIVPTICPDIKGQEELSIYWSENYYIPGNRLRCGTLRLDGFVSVNAPFRGGEFVTKPFTFSGKQLTINYSTSAAGSVAVELQDADGKPIPGHDVKSCPEIYGDAIEHVVTWKGGSDLSQFAGRAIRLRFIMKDADVYALRFVP